jgi:hypothetical protein
MNNYVMDIEIMKQEEAQEVLTSLSLKQMHERLLWAKEYFHLEDQAHNYLRTLVSDLYRHGYKLVAGHWSMRKGLSDRESPQEVYVWSRLDHPEEDFWMEDLQIGITDEVVPASDPSPLISQALALSKAFKDGYSNRSREVQESLTNLLGFSPGQLFNAKVE